MAAVAPTHAAYCHVSISHSLSRPALHSRRPTSTDADAGMPQLDNSSARAVSHLSPLQRHFRRRSMLIPPSASSDARSPPRARAESQIDSQDDPRAFDPLPGAPLGGFAFNPARAAGRAPLPGGARIHLVRGGGGGTGGVIDTPLGAVLAALGWAGGPPGVDGRPVQQQQQQQTQNQEEQRQTGPGNDAEDWGAPRAGAGPLGGRARATSVIGRAEGGANPIPLRNLASFLGESFGPVPAAPHAADHPSNNPFAEGYGHHGPEDAAAEGGGAGSSRARAQSAGADGAPIPHGGAGDGSPFSLLLSLFTALGGVGGGQIVFGPGGGARGNIGDFAFGEAGFQMILNDLMEQAAGRVGPKPATEEIISALPHIKVTQSSLDSEVFKDCPICRDDYEDGDDLLCLECQHTFHPDCIHKWLRTSGTCPVCRFQLVPQNPEPPAAPATSSSSNDRGVPRAHIPGSYSSSPGHRADEMDMDEDMPAVEDLD